MRLRVAIGVLLCASLSTLVRADDFPYTAYVAANDVYVRSGPGKNYYPTSKLQRGDQVQIYRHDPGGWYAIRPPESSFSWISGRYLQPVDDGIAVVTADRVMARVGSALSDIRDVIQVRLYRDEEVEVLEAKRFGNGPGSQTWYKISPPSGEFRWVFGKFVDRDPPAAPDRSEGRRNLLIPQDDSDAVDDDDIDAEDASFAGSDTETSDDARDDANETGRHGDLRTADIDDEERELSDETSRNEHASYEEIREDGRGQSSRSSTKDQELSADHTGPPRRGGSLSSPKASFEEERNELDMALSVMVAEEPTVWSFTELRPRVESLLGRAETAIQRGQARLILGRVARFEDVKQRYQHVVEVGAETDRRNRQLESVRRLRQGAARGSQIAWRFDGVGRLTRVVSPRVDAPRYALVDSSGGVSYYITPVPGLSLHSYVGRRVGVNGSLGSRATVPGKHLTAQRITVLEGRTLR